MNIYERVMKLCSERNIDKTTLEKACGFSQNSINKWKSSMPSIDKIIKVANYFGVTVDYLLCLTDIVDFSDKESKQKTHPSIQASATTTTPHIVAHIDILGTKSMVENKEKNQQLLDTMIGFVDKCKSYVKTFNELQDAAEKLSFKIFSDNIVIYIPFNKEKYNELFCAICLSAIFFQRNLLLNKDLPLPVRGGIAIENLYADDDFVYGQALIDSYQIEENLAIVPRIVVSDAIIETLFNKNKLSQFAGYGKLIVDDFDGFYYLNFLYGQGKCQVKQVQDFVQKTISELKTKHAQQALEKMKSGKNEVKDYSNLYQKYGWLLKYTCNYYKQLELSHLPKLLENVETELKTVKDISDKKAIATEFAKTYEELISDNSFVETAKLYNKITPNQRKLIVGVIAAYFIETLHIDTLPIIGR